MSLEQIESICRKKGTIESVYDYTDIDGNIAIKVFKIRTDTGKTFLQASPLGNGWQMRSPKGLRPLYNLPDISKVDTVFFVEGEKDCHTLADHGFTATTSIGGAGNSRHTDFGPLSGKNIIIWPDYDEAGAKHANNVKDICLKLGCKVSMIEPCDLDLWEKEDVSDYIQQLETAEYTKEQIKSDIQQRMDKANPVMLSSELLRQIDEISSGKRENITLPFTRLSRITQAVLTGTVCLICGSPGSGKSFFVMQCLLHWIKNDVKFAAYLLEDDLAFHLNRALAMLVEDSRLLDTDHVKNNSEIIKDAYNFHSQTLETLAKQIWAETSKQQTYTDLVQWTEARAKEDCKAIVIDPITIAEQSEKPWIADTNLMNKLKEIARKYNTAILLVSHPVKASSNPGMESLAGGAAFSRFSHTILWLQSHNNKTVKINYDCGAAETTINRTLHICKSRNGKGAGLSLGCIFDHSNLQLAEQGIISK